MQVLAPEAVGNDRAGTTLDEKQPEPIAVIGAIGGAQAGWR
jgi:hypothetical protein